MATIALALIRQLAANGTLDAADIDEMAEGLDDRQAHLVRCAFLEGAGEPAPKPSASLHPIDGGKRP